MIRLSRFEPPLERSGAAARLARLNARFRLVATWERRVRLARAGKALLAAYWIGCLAVIGVGLDRLYPAWRGEPTAFVGPQVPQAPEVFAALDAPEVSSRSAFAGFPNCAAAHAAGVYDIPVGSPAYRPEQDGDADGFACDPPRRGRSSHF